MKKTILIAVAIALAGWCGLRSASAQTGTISVTNLEQVIHFDLTGISQGTNTVTNRCGIVSDPPTTIHISSASIISEIGSALGSNFTRHAELVLVTPLDPAPQTVQIHDGTNVTDVTGFFVLGPELGSVSTSSLNLHNGQTTETTYAVDTLKLQSQSGSPALSVVFDVSGFVESISGAQDDRGFGGRRQPDNLFADVSGTGSNGGQPMLVQGSISASGGPVVVTIPVVASN
jgi:hypothetical protein